MHNYFEIYYFIDKFNLKELSNIKRKINIIYRDYSKEINLNEILETKNFCKKKGFKLYLANNLKLATRLGLDGVYLPAFNQLKKYHNLTIYKNFKIIGSAHDIKEIRIKEIQNCEKIFISPIFKTEKNRKFLGTVKFNLLAKNTKKKVIALGGINTENLKKIRFVLRKKQV